MAKVNVSDLVSGVAPKVGGFQKLAMEKSDFQVPIFGIAEIGMLYFALMPRTETDSSQGFFIYACSQKLGNNIVTAYVPNNPDYRPSTHLSGFEGYDSEGVGIGNRQGRNAHNIQCIGTFPALPETDKYAAKPAIFSKLTVRLSWIGEQIAEAWRSGELETIDHAELGIVREVREETIEVAEDCVAGV